MDAEVSVFLGKNPWHSHGFDAARRVLKEIAGDENRTMIVIDPRRTETADLADHWLAVKPGTDAFLLAAIGAVIVEEGLTAGAWLAENVVGYEETIAAFSAVPIADYADHCGIDEATIRTVARRLGSTRSVAFYEDLGIEMAPNSTLVSWLHRAIWTLVGSYGAHGGHSAHTSFIPLFSYGASGNEPTDPVTGGRIISGLIPCNELAEGILSEHPERSRAMIIESANPVHSLAGSAQLRKAMRALDFSVVIDIAMTETALEADYVLPASSQYEKAEVTFFASNFPDNHITLRAPLLEPLDGTLPEAEIHARLARAMGVYSDAQIEPLREAARESREAFAEAFTAAAMENPQLAGVGALVLYETLGSTLPDGLAPAAALWFSTQQLAMKYPDQVRAAGHAGEGADLGWALFDAFLTSRDGIVFTSHEHGDAFDLLKTPDQKIHIHIPELAEELALLAQGPVQHTTDEFPVVLSAGERRNFTANTIMRDPAWRKRDAEGALRLSVGDAARYGIGDGDRVRSRLLVGPVSRSQRSTRQGWMVTCRCRTGWVLPTPRPVANQRSLVSRPTNLRRSTGGIRSPARPGTSTFRPELSAWPREANPFRRCHLSTCANFGSARRLVVAPDPARPPARPSAVQ